jgi:alkylation response protein AidB-like acyl-CoA dehydrogenase
MFFPPFGRVSISTFLTSTTLQVAVVGEEFATECGGLALLLLDHNLGVAPLLLSGHIPTWLRHLIPQYIKSTWLRSTECMAFAITEPEAGSDVQASEGAVTARLNTTAGPVKGGYILRGRKCFISNGALADRISIYAKLEGEDIQSWTCFLIDKKMKGVTVGRHERKMGQRASDSSEIILDDVFVPKKNIIGKLRSGRANGHNVLHYSRPVVGAMALGHGRGAFERALAFCRKEKLGPKRLIDYKDVQYVLADMVLDLWAARSLVWRSCSNFRAQQSASAAAKAFASDTAFKVCNQAMELMGDKGYLHEHGVERALRDSRLAQIYEGTNQICRYDIIEHQWDIEIDKSTDKTARNI